MCVENLETANGHPSAAGDTVAHRSSLVRSTKSRITTGTVSGRPCITGVEPADPVAQEPLHILLVDHSSIGPATRRAGCSAMGRVDGMMGDS